MNYKTPVLLACLAVLCMGGPSFAHDFSTLHEGEIERNMRNLDTRIEVEESAWDAYRAQELVDTVRQDTLQGTSGVAWTTDNFADRFINPRPELGCMYYDENNVRHWFPNCREL